MAAANSSATLACGTKRSREKGGKKRICECEEAPELFSQEKLIRYWRPYRGSAGIQHLTDISKL